MVLAQAALDELWDFADPAGSEGRLRAAAAAAPGAERAELLTQVARALGLRERFTAADAALDEASAEAAHPAVRTRVALERGRLRNSGGDAVAALPLFADAAEVAAVSGLEFLQVDALHMLAIAEPARADEWTDIALRVLDSVTEPRTLRWRVSLENNRGWARFDAGRTADALASFVASRDAAVRWGTPEQVSWADEAIAQARAALAAD